MKQDIDGDAKPAQACQPVWIKTGPLVSRCARAAAGADAVTGAAAATAQNDGYCSRTDCLFGIRRG